MIGGDHMKVSCIYGKVRKFFLMWMIFEFHMESIL